MTEHMQSTDPDPEKEIETYPVEPRYHPVHKLTRKIYDALASAKLAMALLVVILICCLTGVTIVRGEQAWLLIFNTLWFNAILVLLVVNVACCFFGRIWHRKLTIISFGMILFHASFIAILLGIVYNSLFYFRGNIRLTEGEVLKSGDPQSYDKIEQGMFFNFSRLKGETSLVKMNAGYMIGREDKRAAYEVIVGESGDKKQGIIYITHKLTHKGFDYFNDKEGYSLLVMLSDKYGRELYGAHLPLQSIIQNDGSYLYTTGYSENGAVMASAVRFPAKPQDPLFEIEPVYHPSSLKDRGGEVTIKLASLDGKGVRKSGPLFAEGKLPVGEYFAAGDYGLTVKEVRYWAGMLVRYEPGKPVVLTSLWVALTGMIITTAGRMFRERKKAE